MCIDIYVYSRIVKQNRLQRGASVRELLAIQACSVCVVLGRMLDRIVNRELDVRKELWAESKM
jgi:hypothetical protein